MPRKQRPKIKAIHKTFIKALAMSGIVGLTFIRPDLKEAGEVRDVIRITEFYDGYVHALAVETPFWSFSSPIGVNERHAATAGFLAVWQRLTDKGWQIVLYDAENNKEIELTKASEDQTEPHTDGRYVVWQGKESGIWNIYLYDTFDPKQEVQKINQNTPAKKVRVSNGLVVWQEWNKDNWEVMTWENGRNQNISNSSLQDIEPDVLYGMIVWMRKKEEVHEIIATNIRTGEEGSITEEAISFIRPTFLRDATLQWYAITNEAYIRRRYNFQTDEDATDLVEIVKSKMLKMNDEMDEISPQDLEPEMQTDSEPTSTFEDTTSIPKEPSNEPEPEPVPPLESELVPLPEAEPSANSELIEI